jgi:hypothetical protein
MAWTKPHNTAPAKPNVQSGLKSYNVKDAGIFTGNKTPKPPIKAIVPPARNGGTRV